MDSKKELIGIINEPGFTEQRPRAETAVGRLPPSTENTGTYRFSSVDQAYERFRLMLRECRKRALAEPFEAAAARGGMLRICTRAQRHLMI